MGAEPGRRFLKQPAAKLEPVYIAIGSNICLFLFLLKVCSSQWNQFKFTAVPLRQSLFTWEQSQPIAFSLSTAELI